MKQKEFKNFKKQNPQKLWLKVNNNVIIITGQRGSGKTSYILQNLYRYDRLIIFDLLGEFITSLTCINLKEFFNLLSKKKNENFFSISYYNPKTSDEDFSIICKAINRLENITYVVDEVDYFCHALYIPKEFGEIIKRGRHQGLGLIVATRRPHEIPRLLTSQVTEFVTFRHVEPKDVDYIRSICEIDSEELKTLPNFHYIKWTQGILSRGSVRPVKKTSSKNLLLKP